MLLCCKYTTYLKNIDISICVSFYMYKGDLGINIYYEEVCDIFGNLHRFLPTRTKFFQAKLDHLK